MNKLPKYMHGAIERYINHGIEPGSFLKAIIINDLKGAIGKADHINIGLIPEYVKYFYNEVPSNCWGSVEAYEEWIKKGGLKK